MQKAFLVMVTLVIFGTANATATVSAKSPFEIFQQMTIQPVVGKQLVGLGLINWTVGDNAKYNMDMGFVKGTMVMSVTSITTDEVWIAQDMNLGFLGQQKAETLIDTNTGAVKKMIVNGKEQEIPEQDLELIEIIDDTVTVPAGTFDCQHVRLKDNKSGDEIKIWSNATVAMSGMVKTIQPGQFGEVTVELTSFLKQ